MEQLSATVDAPPTLLTDGERTDRKTGEPTEADTDSELD